MIFIIWALVAVLSGLAILMFPSQQLAEIAKEPKALFHVLLAIFTFSVLVVAGLQAVVLAIQEKALHRKSIPAFFRTLPPLQTMEVFLFRTISVGFVLLTVLITTSLYFFHDRVTAPLFQKLLLAALAWIIFGVLLIGRYVLGWRGKKAIYGTLIGVLLLLLLYIGSILLLGTLI